MLLRAFFRPMTTVAAVALLAACGSLFNTAEAQGLKWQRGAANPTAAAKSTPQAGSVARRELRQAKPPRQAAIRQVAYEQPAQPAARPSRAKRPSPGPSRGKAAASRAPAAKTASRPAPQKDANVERAMAGGDVSFASAVQQANGNIQAGGSQVKPAGFACVGGCACGCGGGCEPGCCLPEPGCCVGEPGCCIGEPGCGCGPTCGCGPEVYGDACGDCCCGEVGCVGGCCGTVACGCGVADCLGGCAARGAVPLTLYVPPLQELILFGGVQGFKSPLDYEPGSPRDAGNFGFHQGVNAGGIMSWLPWPGLGYQIGYQATQNQLSGDATSTQTDSHTQSFLTAGLFKRRFAGFQYGVVYDLLQDERQGSHDFGQVRGLLSMTNPRGGEVGFQFATHTNSQSVNASVYEATDQYLFFYRYHGCRGGEFRVFGGGDDDSRGIVGGDLFAPLNERWSIQAGFTYLIPSDGGNLNHNATEEAWNLSMSLVWHYGCRGKQWYKSPWRPLFNVANNGSLVVDDVD